MKVLFSSRPYLLLSNARQSFFYRHFCVANFINGQFTASKAAKGFPVCNPATQQVVGAAPQSTHEEMDNAITAAHTAFHLWRAVPIAVRQRYFFKLHAIIRDRQSELAEILTVEQGKTLEDAKGDVFRGLEVVEFACSSTTVLMGETSQGVAANMDTYSYRQPLGVCAGIAPFNFPAMIPLWMFPMAIVAGNTFVLKPSERVPMSTMKLCEWVNEVGLPPGVLTVIHGARDTVDFLCRDPRIRALSFVGGDKAGEYIFAEGTRHGKRVQSNMGAKNHAVVLPDAAKDDTLNMLCNAAFGAAGQRCMAISVAVMVGKAKDWIPELITRAQKLKVGNGMDKTVDIGPLISREAKEKVRHLVEKGIKEGARMTLDGLSITVDGYPNGNFIGATVLEDVTTEMTPYTEEVFGPVLSVICVDSLDRAIEVVNSNPKGNGCAVFTRDGASARKFQTQVNVGQVGINVPIPVPLPMFSFTGWKGSMRGDLNFYGKSGFHFFTQVKTITSRWKPDDDSLAQSTLLNCSFPTLG